MLNLPDRYVCHEKRVTTNIAVTKFIDKGARWQDYLNHPVFDHLKSDVRFQAQVNYQNR
jgi:hypothetical protein